jgi:hypothetical protein
MGGTSIADPSLVASGETWFGGRPALGLCLGLITVLATITVIQRILHVIRQPPPEEQQ